MPEKLRREAAEVAAGLGISLSQLIRDQLEVVTRGLSRGGGREDDPLFANAAPVDVEGPSDLAARHDDYLYGGL